MKGAAASADSSVVIGYRTIWDEGGLELTSAKTKKVSHVQHLLRLSLMTLMTLMTWTHKPKRFWPMKQLLTKDEATGPLCERPGGRLVSLLLAQHS